jgi:hypothetical protein
LRPAHLKARRIVTRIEAACDTTYDAQQPRRIGVMIALSEGDSELKKWLAAFRQRLRFGSNWEDAAPRRHREEPSKMV